MLKKILGTFVGEVSLLVKFQLFISFVARDIEGPKSRFSRGHNSARKVSWGLKSGVSDSLGFSLVTCLGVTHAQTQIKLK